MPSRRVVNTFIVLWFIVAVIFSLSYGPATRIFTSPEKTYTVASAKDLEKTWQTHGVHGRVAVIFSSHLKPQPGSVFPERDYLDRALNEGVVRKVEFVVPDAIWAHFSGEIVRDYTLIMPPHKTDAGMLLLHVGGRINMMPISKYIPGSEQALVIYEPEVWSYQERTRIEGMLTSKQLKTDLLMIVDTTAASAATATSFRQW